MRLDARYTRASAYFLACLVLAALAGVPGTLDWSAPVWAVVGCLALEVVAYGLVWPIGTYTLERRKDWASTAFGLCWGLCEGPLLLAGYLLVDRLGLGDLPTVALAFVLLAAFQGMWHALYWDLKVAPEHNDPAWNLRKVLLCHTPNLVATLSFFSAYGAGAWFVVFQVVALSLSARAMRFPRPAHQLVEVPS